MKPTSHVWKLDLPKYPLPPKYWVDTSGGATSVLAREPRSHRHKDAIHASGTGGGKLVFLTDGTVLVIWNETAAIASSHASGNRKLKITEESGKNLPQRLTDSFSMVADVRRVGRQGFEFPEDHEDAGILRLLEIHQKLAWRMVRAVGIGDFDDIRLIADALEAFDKMHSGVLETPIAQWVQVANAIKSAAVTHNGIPRYIEVYSAFTSCTKGESLRNSLQRMGFGWLPKGRERQQT